MTIDAPPCPYPCTYEGHHWHTSDGTRALCASTIANGHRCPYPWTPDNPLGCVTTSLAVHTEAVLPDLLADVWDECCTAWQAYLDGRTDNVPPLNPYRPTAPEGDSRD